MAVSREKRPKELNVKKLYDYIKSRSKINLLTGILILLATIVLVSFTISQIVALVNDPYDYLLEGSASIDPLNESIAAYLSRLMPLGLVLLMVVTVYLFLESHSLGSKISVVLAATFFGAAALNVVDPQLMIFSGVLCISASIIQIVQLKKNGKKDRPIVTEKVAKVGLLLSAFVCIAMLLGVFVYVGARGLNYLSWEFITSPAGSGYADIAKVIAGIQEGSIGGVRDALLGTALLVSFCEVIAIPLGVCAAIYLSEYASKNRLVDIIRFFTETLAGAPSAVLGIFGYAIFVYGFGWGHSLAAGGLALAFMILPWNIRVTEEALKSVPQSYREAAFALGASKWQAIRKTVLLPASPGVITGVMLGVGAAIGETAVLMWTATPMGTPGVLPESIALTQQAIPNLAVWTFGAFMNIHTGLPTDVNMSLEAQNVTYAGAFVLLIMFLIVTGIALLLRNYLAKKTGAMA